ncbi:hypothetical protein HYX08_05555 [Candidatus Woesearchaeota archaeon]|nr:hypothetical protein [Candidatus Woesearchaeota archaeon]
MKKVILPVLIFLIISIAACQPAKEVKEAPKGTTGDAAADSSSDLGSADDVEKDLDSSELNELDSGFNDVQSI